LKLICIAPILWISCAILFPYQALPPLAYADVDLRYKLYCDFSCQQVLIDCQPSSKSQGVILPKNIKQAFDKTLSWECRFAAISFRGLQRGAVRHSCLLFYASLEDLNVVLQEEHHSKADWEAGQMDAGTVESLSH
jgi:hypothetical protein